MCIILDLCIENSILHMLCYNKRWIVYKAKLAKKGLCAYEVKWFMY